MDTITWSYVSREGVDRYRVDGSPIFEVKHYSNGGIEMMLSQKTVCVVADTETIIGTSGPYASWRFAEGEEATTRGLLESFLNPQTEIKGKTTRELADLRSLIRNSLEYI